MRDIHKMGGALVPVLWLQAEDKTKEPEVQGKAQGAEYGLAIIKHHKQKDPAHRIGKGVEPEEAGRID
jgi:hypothetical protein